MAQVEGNMTFGDCEHTDAFDLDPTTMKPIIKKKKKDDNFDLANPLNKKDEMFSRAKAILARQE